jgi:hypothetical protein
VLDPSPPQRAWPVPDRLGAEPSEKLKGRCPNHGGYKQGEGPTGGDYPETLADAVNADFPGWVVVPG